MSLKATSSGLNKAAQKSSLFQKAKSLLWETNLKTEARADAVQKLKAQTSDLANDIGLNLKNAEKDTVARSGKIKSTIDEMAGSKFATDEGKAAATPWKDADDDAINSVYDYAKETLYADHHIDDEVGNTGDYIDEYAGAVKAANKQIHANTRHGMISGYYMNPLYDGRYGTVAARAGVTAGAVAAPIILGSSLSGDDYSSDY